MIQPPLSRIAVIGAALLVAACASRSSPTSSTGTRQQTTALAFARCMRSHGVPNFPDPGAGGPPVDQRSPAFRVAQQACRQLDPKASPPPTHPSANQRQGALRFAHCMRTHGYPDFPDPVPTLPSTPSGTVLGAFDLYYVLGPGTGTRPHSSAFLRTATDCGVNPLGGTTS